MKKWWKSLDKNSQRSIKIASCLIILIGIVIPHLVFFAIYINDTGSNRIIYDGSRQEIIEKVGFLDWYGDIVWEERNYFYLVEEYTITDTVGNMAYRAKLYMPRKNRAAEKFLTEGMAPTWISYNELHEAISRCVDKVGRQSYRDQNFEGYPSITVRALSLSASYLDIYCTIPERFGYEWSGNLEIVQCNGDLPLDNARKNDCLNAARLANYP